MVDTTEANPLQGAAAMLVDEDLEVVSVRLYDQQEDRRRTGSGWPGDRPRDPLVKTTQRTGATGRRLLERALSDAVAVAVPERHRGSETIIERSTSDGSSGPDRS